MDTTTVDIKSQQEYCDRNNVAQINPMARMLAFITREEAGIRAFNTWLNSRNNDLDYGESIEEILDTEDQPRIGDIKQEQNMVWLSPKALAEQEMSNMEAWEPTAHVIPEKNAILIRTNDTSEFNYVSVHELAGEIGCSTSTIYNWIRQGKVNTPRESGLHGLVIDDEALVVATGSYLRWKESRSKKELVTV